jgi:hypothetical protein
MPALAVLSLIALIALPACNSMKQRIPVVAYSSDGDYLEPQYGRGLVIDEQSTIPDVPKPIGFVLVRSQSSASFDGSARTLTHVYQGRASVDELLEFFRRVLKGNGWQVAGPTDAPILSYVKGSESLNLSVGSDGKRATVTLVIYPRVG